MFWEFLEENCHHLLPISQCSTCWFLFIINSQTLDVGRCTCLNFGVVGPLCHFLLADEVINNPDTDWRLSVVPLHDDQ